MDSINKMPVGSFYTGKDGNLNVKVGKDAENNIIVNAISDSIGRVHRSVVETRTSSKNLVSKEVKPPDKQTSKIDGFWITSGKISAAIVAIIVFFYFRKKGIINF